MSEAFRDADEFMSWHSVGTHDSGQMFMGIRLIGKFWFWVWPELTEWIRNVSFVTYLSAAVQYNWSQTKYSNAIPTNRKNYYTDLQEDQNQAKTNSHT